MAGDCRNRRFQSAHAAGEIISPRACRGKRAVPSATRNDMSRYPFPHQSSRPRRANSVRLAIHIGVRSVLRCRLRSAGRDCQARDLVERQATGRRGRRQIHYRAPKPWPSQTAISSAQKRTHCPPESAGDQHLLPENLDAKHTAWALRVVPPAHALQTRRFQRSPPVDDPPQKRMVSPR